MALHRDIFWIGRQWAVTGFGMQVINQKLGGEYDIAIERLWDDDRFVILREQKWFNPDDFDKGLAVARARYPRPQGKPPPLRVETLLQASGVIARPAPAASSAAAAVEAPAPVAMETAPTPAQPKKRPPSFPCLSIAGHPAKLLKIWRVRRRH